MAAAPLALCPAAGVWVISIFQFERAADRVACHPAGVCLFVYFAGPAFLLRRTGRHSFVTRGIPVGGWRSVLSFHPGLCAPKSSLGRFGRIWHGALCLARCFLS